MSDPAPRVDLDEGSTMDEETCGFTICEECNEEEGIELIGATTHCEICGVRVWE